MADPSIPSWNVLHVLGFDDPEKYKRIPDVTEPILRELDPAKGFSDIYGALVGYRAKRRHIIADLVPGMMVD